LRRLVVVFALAQVLALLGVASPPIRTASAATCTPPAVTGVSPGYEQGDLYRSTPVTITGCGFTGATAVHFGDLTAAFYTVDSDTQITATPYFGSVGQVDITVTTPLGTTLKNFQTDGFVFTEQATYCATFDTSGIPTTWKQGVATTFSIMAFNCGLATWVASGDFRTDLDFHFTDTPADDSNYAGSSLNAGNWIYSLALNSGSDVPSGGHETVTFTVTPQFFGHEYPEVLMLVEHRYWFDQETTYPIQWAPHAGFGPNANGMPQLVLVSRSVYCASYDLSAIPTTWHKGVATTFSVPVTNCGDITWPSTGFNEIDLDMHFASSPGGSANQSNWLTSLALPPSADVAPNATASITFTITPNFFGHEYMEALMIDEHVFWFDQETPSPVQFASVYVLVSAT